MSESLKEMSRSGQDLAKECSEPVAEKMIGNLKKVKEMFSQIHRGVSERCVSDIRRDGMIRNHWKMISLSETIITLCLSVI